MIEPYAFDHEGASVEFFPSTVRSSLEAVRLQQKLLGAYGYVGDNAASDDVADNIYEYAQAMARTKTTDAPWYAHSNMDAQALIDAFECFLDQEGSLHTRYRIAVLSTAQPKKTPIPITETLTPSKDS